MRKKIGHAEPMAPHADSDPQLDEDSLSEDQNMTQQTLTNFNEDTIISGQGSTFDEPCDDLDHSELSSYNELSLSHLKQEMNGIMKKIGILDKNKKTFSKKIGEENLIPLDKRLEENQ
jgi:hypothetical protein